MTVIRQYRVALASGSGLLEEQYSSAGIRERLACADRLARESLESFRLDAAKSILLAEEALSLIQSLPDTVSTPQLILLEARIHHSLGAAKERLSDYDSAFRSAEEALRLGQQAREMCAGESELLRQALDACLGARTILGNICDRRGDYGAALEHHRANLHLSSETGDASNKAHALLQLGATYYRLGDYPGALQAYLEARPVLEAVQNLRGLGSAWNGIGNIRYSEDRYDEALVAYQMALSQFEQSADPYWQAGLLSNIAGVHLKLENVTEARECLQYSLRLREEFGDRHGQGYSLSSLSEILRRDGDFKTAREYGELALSLFEQIGDRAGQASIRISLATTASAEGNWTQAERYRIEALEISETLGLREMTYQIHAELSHHHESLGDLGQALHHYKKFHTLKEELLNETSSGKLRDLEVLHRVAQAQRESELLRHHNEELSAANARQAELLEQLRHQSITLEKQARTDALTDLLNRRSLEEAFNAAYEEALEQEQPLSVALIDIDHFKRINDRFSHQMGDAVLRTVARLLKQNCRGGDVLARYGGEEFVLVLPDTTLESAVVSCDRMRRLVASHNWVDLHPDLQVTVSFGICGDMSVSDPEQMLSYADARLYEAKAAGRNRTRA